MDIKKNQILNYALHGDLDSLIQSKLEGDFHWSRCVNKSTGDTPIHLAAQNNHVAVLQFLCDKWLPCNIELCNKDGKRAMHFAAQHHNYETIIYLITKVISPNINTHTLEYPIGVKNMLLKLMRDCAAKVEVGASSGVSTILHGRITERKHIGNDADINCLKRADWTPLMLACCKVSDAMQKSVETLLKFGALPQIKNKDGWNAFHLAVRAGDSNVVKLLIPYCARFLLDETKNGRTALHIAGANVNATNGLGYTCLHLAAQSGHAEIIVFLVRDLDQRVNTISNADECKTPLHCAGRSKNADIFDLLISLGADKNVLDVHKRTAEYYLLL